MKTNAALPLVHLFIKAFVVPGSGETEMNGIHSWSSKRHDRVHKTYNRADDCCPRVCLGSLRTEPLDWGSGCKGQGRGSWMRWAVPLHLLVLLPGTPFPSSFLSQMACPLLWQPFRKADSSSLYHCTLFISSPALTMVPREWKVGKEKELAFFWIPTMC